ncbi:hypothetical protein ACFL6S_01025 [Candidatus Poribacteria bacterium]
MECRKGRSVSFWTMLPTILKYKLRQIYNAFNHSSRQKRLGWIISIAFIIPYYVEFISSMTRMYDARHTALKWEGLAQMAIANLALVFLFVLISTSALTLYRMFQAKDLPLLMSLPMGDGQLFLAKFSESLAYTARNMILPLPICISLISVIGKVESPLAALAAAIFAVGWIGIMIQLTGLSVIIALILGRLIITNRWGVVLRIIAVVASLAFLLIFFTGYVYQAGPGISLFSFAQLPAILPTSWLVAALPYAGSSITINVLCGVGFLTVTAAFPAAAFWIFRRRFRRLWAIAVEVKQRKGKQKSGVRGASSSTGAMGNTRAIVFKDSFTMRREPHTWVGLMIVLVLFPVFIFLRTDELGQQASYMQSVYIIVVSLMTTASYSMSCVGREGRSFALLRSLPVRMSILLRAKFLLGCAINLVVTLAFVMALYLARKSSAEQMWYNVLIGTVSAVYLSAFGTALAAIFPKFDYNSPIRAASLPGFLILYFTVFLFGFTFVVTTTIGWHFTPLVLAPWAGIILILMKVGQSRLEKMDV